jgi:type IV pilus assembly protein PilC
MARFDYAAETLDGTIVRGHLKANNPAAARTKLLERDFVLADVEQRASRVPIRRGRVSQTELMHLSRQLAAFLRAGIPILEALELLTDESANVSLRGVLASIANAVRSGETFAEAVEQHSTIFPSSYRAMLRAAELTGELDLVLEQLSTYLERDIESRAKIRSALTYPAIVAVMSVVSILIITVFVLPRFRVFFNSLGRELPLPTRILIGVTDFIGTFWYVLVSVAAVATVGVVMALRTGRGRMLKDRLLLRIPVLRDIIRFSAVERFCRILSTMLVAGVPVPEGMTVASAGVGNLVYQDALAQAREDVLEGHGISRPLAASGVFPSAATQMLRVGESTGSLDHQLIAASRFYEKELDFKVKRMTTLIEPAVIVFMGLIVGFVAVALISAMYGIFRGGAL